MSVSQRIALERLLKKLLGGSPSPKKTRKRPMRLTYQPRFKSQITKQQPTVHSFKRVIHWDTISTSNTAAYQVEWNFAFDDLDHNSTGYTDGMNVMYDYYKINKVVFELVPRFSEANVSATGMAIPNIHSIVDYDGTSFTGVDGMLQYPNYKRTRGQRRHIRSLVPKVSVDINSAATSAKVLPKSWLDMNDTDLAHKGLKIYIDKLVNQDNTTISTATELHYDVYITYYWSCKGQR